MTGAPEGRIEMRLRRRPGRSPAVEMRSTRRALAQKLLAGQTPERATQLAGLLFSLCGQAQRTAAELATGAAMGAWTGRLDAVRAHPVLAELAREHAWRLAIDWPRQAGRNEDAAVLRRLRQAGSAEFAAVLAEVLAKDLLGEAPDAWLAAVSGAAGLSAFDAWRARAATPLAALFRDLDGVDEGGVRQPLLPSLDELGPEPILAVARAALADEAFCLAPRLAGRPAETGALGRCHAEPALRAWTMTHGPGLGAHMLARLIELARLPARLADETPGVAAAWGPEPGLGVAAVETSRGLLIHALRLAQGRIAEYRIVAPTEWNFQAGGPLALALAALPDGDDLDARARRLALAMDPCVDYRIEVSDA